MRLQQGGGLRPLQGEQRPRVRLILHLHVKRPHPLLQPRPVLVDVGRIDHQEVPRFSAAVHQEVVHDASVGVWEAGILHLTGDQFGDVVAGDVLQKSQGVRSFHGEFAHVGNVKEASGLAHGMVLLHQSGVLDGHFVARKRNHFGAHSAMYVGKGGGF